MDNKIKKRLILAIATAIIILMATVPNLGYIHTPWVEITIIHIPVIVIAMIFGYRAALYMGLVFATSSLLVATFRPNPMSFLFSPFYKLGEIGGGIPSLIICYLPRILMALTAALLYRKAMSKKMVFIGAFLSSMVNTVLVIFGIYIFYIDDFAKVIKVSPEKALFTLASLLCINGVLEAICAGIIALAVVYRLAPKKN